MDERRCRFEAQALPHLNAAYNLALWLTRSPPDADDIVQEAMLRAFRSFDGFRGDDAKPWLLAIVRNCWRSRGADAKRRGQVPLPDNDDTLSDDSKDPETIAIDMSQGKKLNELIARLPEEFREALVLREMEEMSYREIAATVGIPVGTVMSRLARAREMLKQKWLAETCA